MGYVFVGIYYSADSEGNECHRRAIKICLIRHLKSPSLFNLDVDLEVWPKQVSNIIYVFS